MIRFVAKRSPQGKLILGLVILPADLARLLSGNPEFTRLADLGVDETGIESVGVYAFRDLGEFKDAMREAGVEPGQIAISDPSEDGIQHHFTSAERKNRSN
jgi:hypothetical protein